MQKHEAISRYKQLLNEILPATFTAPVRLNHCFNRIVLDCLFQDVWYDHLNRSKTAISQLNDQQLENMTFRMEQWLKYPGLLDNDNKQSLKWRRKKLEPSPLAKMTIMCTYAIKRFLKFAVTCTHPNTKLSIANAAGLLLNVKPIHSPSASALPCS